MCCAARRCPRQSASLFPSDGFRVHHLQTHTLSLKEFDRAAEKFDDDDPGVYNMCRRDYPDVLAEAVREPFSDLGKLPIDMDIPFVHDLVGYRYLNMIHKPHHDTAV